MFGASDDGYLARGSTSTRPDTRDSTASLQESSATVSVMTATALRPTEKTRRICTTRAPAKINLSLEVLGKRPDGYHDIRSLLVGVGLFDELAAQRTCEPGIFLACDAPELETTGNLAIRAAEWLAGETGRDPAVRLTLKKRIPVAAGLGGGSSDAAATLRVCRELWQMDLSPEELSEVGAKVGSDVPFFFHLPSAVISGRGEKVSPVTLRWRGRVLLVMPPIRVSTATVYAAWHPADRGPAADEVAGAIPLCETAAEIAEQTVNHLEPAAFRVEPRLAELFGLLGSMNVGRPRLSGSGSAMYLLFDDPQSAAHAESAIQNRIPQVRTATLAAPVGETPVECK
jgi:4-diphosphocytidyl-2-C-methyl-D-erythritol kinase